MALKFLLNSRKNYKLLTLKTRKGCPHLKVGQPFSFYNYYFNNVSAGTYSSPCASATALMRHMSFHMCLNLFEVLDCPSMLALHLCLQFEVHKEPLHLSRPIVDVRGTAPGIFATA